MASNAKGGGAKTPPSIFKGSTSFKGPTRFNPKRSEWEPIHKVREPPLGSPEYPKWICKNSCGQKPIDEESAYNHCPNCKAPLVRWLKYEVKK